GKITLKWSDVKKDLFENGSRRMNDYPTVKILASGLENHITNGFNWQKVSAEVERAIESRAASEIETLRGKSWVDWFWNLGAISPLLGLFGTVTGITKVFAQIMTLGKGTSHLDLVKQLSSGIFEALWTTIYGLLAGITLMMIYYLFKNNLEWIYNKWQSIFVHVTEEL
ncbi:MAG: MotA/TolQ/ExbB proton channel family protein, partial [Calditrichaeota bacterium]